jgi:hypothetical protein
MLRIPHFLDHRLTDRVRFSALHNTRAVIPERSFGTQKYWIRTSWQPKMGGFTVRWLGVEQIITLIIDCNKTLHKFIGSLKRPKVEEKQGSENEGQRRNLAINGNRYLNLFQFPVYKTAYRVLCQCYSPSICWTAASTRWKWSPRSPSFWSSEREESSIIVRMWRVQNRWVRRVYPSSAIRNDYQTQHFGNGICFRLQVRGGR